MPSRCSSLPLATTKPEVLTASRCRSTTGGGTIRLARQLSHPVNDRRQGHGISQAERPVLLVFSSSSAVLFASFFVPGGAAAAGWTGCPPLSAKNEYTGGGYGMDLWLLSLALEFTSFLLGGINFLTTTMNLRAPGLTWFRLPILVWMQLTAALIFMLSVGPTIAGAILLLMDRISAPRSTFPTAAVIHCYGSICFGFSATLKFTSYSCPASASCSK